MFKSMSSSKKTSQVSSSTELSLPQWRLGSSTTGLSKSSNPQFGVGEDSLHVAPHGDYAMLNYVNKTPDRIWDGGHESKRLP